MTLASSALAEQFAAANIEASLLMLARANDRTNFILVLPAICTPGAARDGWEPVIKDVLGAASDVVITSARPHKDRIWLRGHFKDTDQQ